MTRRVDRLQWSSTGVALEGQFHESIRYVSACIIIISPPCHCIRTRNALDGRALHLSAYKLRQLNGQHFAHHISEPYDDPRASMDLLPLSQTKLINRADRIGGLELFLPKMICHVAKKIGTKTNRCAILKQRRKIHGVHCITFIAQRVAVRELKTNTRELANRAERGKEFGSCHQKVGYQIRTQNYRYHISPAGR